MPDYELYWIERPNEKPRDPTVLGIEARGVMQAGVFLAGKNVESYEYIAIPYDQFEINKGSIDRVVNSSDNPQAIFSRDIVVARANFRTTNRLTFQDLITLDRLMEGIGMVRLRKKK